jgi:hypothetical protein
MYRTPVDIGISTPSNIRSLRIGSRQGKVKDDTVRESEWVSYMNIVVGPWSHEERGQACTSTAGRLS